MRAVHIVDQNNNNQVNAEAKAKAICNSNVNVCVCVYFSFTQFPLVLNSFAMTTDSQQRSSFRFVSVTAPHCHRVNIIALGITWNDLVMKQNDKKRDATPNNPFAMVSCV